MSEKIDEWGFILEDGWPVGWSRLAFHARQAKRLLRPIYRPAPILFEREEHHNAHVLTRRKWLQRVSWANSSLNPRLIGPRPLWVFQIATLKRPWLSEISCAS